MCAYARRALVNNRFECTVLAHKHTMGLGLMYLSLRVYVYIAYECTVYVCAVAELIFVRIMNFGRLKVETLLIFI